MRTAFQTTPHAEGDEQDFVVRQRSAEFYTPELALLLEDESQLIAYIMLTLTFVSTSFGQQPILLLACVAVLARRRNQGIGSKLIEDTLQRARALGHTLVILVGDPGYYARFGFRSSAQFGIFNENGIEPEYVQISELSPGALHGISGTIALPT